MDNSEVNVVPWKRKEVIGNATLYLGDCMNVLPAIGQFDSLVTDPPYGVDLSYAANDDSESHLRDIVLPRVRLGISLGQRAALTCGNKNAWLYPRPDDWGVWYNPAGTGCGRWGFILAHMILYYGIDPHARKAGWKATSVEGLNDATPSMWRGHPCPKPEAFMRWLVGKASLPTDTVCDPFMGSGTTGAACSFLGRKFVGVELHEPYFDLACERIENAQRQHKLFA